MADISPGIAGQQQQPGPCLPAGVADISPGIAGQQQQPGPCLSLGWEWRISAQLDNSNNQDLAYHWAGSGGYQPRYSWTTATTRTLPTSGSGGYQPRYSWTTATTRTLPTSGSGGYQPRYSWTTATARTLPITGLGVADISPGIAGQQQQPGPCLSLGWEWRISAQV